ncbi:hypothetical protein D3C71_1598530 [compost metagenome]
MLKHAEWEALSALEGLNGTGVVLRLIFELIVDPLFFYVLPLPRRHATGGRVGYVLRAVAALVHLVKKFPVTHVFPPSSIAR